MGEGSDALAAGKGMGHGAKVAIEELAETFLKWIVPLVAVVLGVFLYQSLGGNGLFWALLSETTNQANSQIGALAKWLCVFLWGGIGLAIWACGSSVEKWGKWIIHGIGAFFVGVALGWVGDAIRNQPTPPGLLDDLLTTVEEQAQNSVGA